MVAANVADDQVGNILTVHAARPHFLIQKPGFFEEPGFYLNNRRLFILSRLHRYDNQLALNRLAPIPTLLAAIGDGKLNPLQNLPEGQRPGLTLKTR
jgi:hypothetical protein